jgi:hypothetical protein
MACDIVLNSNDILMVTVVFFRKTKEQAIFSRLFQLTLKVKQIIELSDQGCDYSR